MYYRIKIQDVVRLPPMFMEGDIKEGIKEVLNQEIVGTVDKDIGVIVAVTDVGEIGEGYMVPGDGSVYYDAIYGVLAFQPQIQEVIEGEFKEAAEFGAFITIGPMDGLVHVSQIMEDYVSFNEKEGLFAGKESRNMLKVGDRVRARIVTVSKKNTVLDTKIGFTMRQPYLGALHWKTTTGGKDDKRKEGARKSVGRKEREKSRNKRMGGKRKK